MLGISVYLHQSELAEVIEYCKKAAALGYRRIFTCLLSMPKDDQEAYLKKCKEFFQIAHDLNFIVSVDINPELFDVLHATVYDLKPFVDLGVDIIRLDGNFGGLKDVLLTHNSHQIKIEFNASHDTGVSNLIEQGANRDQMMMCHNFFPQRYTGLNRTLFHQLNQKWDGLHLPVAAFITSQQSSTIGPWNVSCGLCTIEEFRTLPIAAQARYLWACGEIKDIIIGNYPASYEELQAVALTNPNRIQLRVQEEGYVSDLEREIMYECKAHMDRQDRSAYVIRSTFSKGIYGTQSIPGKVKVHEYFKRGDVVIVNDHLSHYRGELQIVLQKIPNDGERNLVGHICEEEMMLLEFIKPGRIFQLIRS